MARISKVEAGFYRIPLEVAVSDSMHGEMLAFELNTLRITDADGLAREFGPGEGCIIPGGFTGTFEVLEAVRKYYVVVERQD